MSFTLYYGGAEQPLSAQILEDEGVSHVVVSFFEWQRRNGGLLADVFSSNVQICLTPGVTKRNHLDWDKFVPAYMQFAEDNADRLALVLEIDNPACPPSWVETLRDQLNHFNGRLVVFPSSMSEATHISTHRIGVSSRTAKLFKELRGAPVHVVNTSSSKLILDCRAVSASTYSWLSPRRFGEAWIFDQKLLHFSADRLGALGDHREAIERLEVDPMAALSGDTATLQVLAIRSLQVWATDLAHKLAKRPVLSVVDGARSHPANSVVQRVDFRSRSVVPVIDLDSLERPAEMVLSGVVLRQCDSCYLSSKCPRFAPASECSYRFPEKVSTPEERRQAAQVLIDMQFKRVTFGFFAEQVEGMPISDRQGREMDRYFKMLSELKTLDEETPKATTRGILSELFGIGPHGIVDAEALPEGDTDG